MKKVSKTLEKWADVLVFLSVVLFAMSLFGFFFNSAWLEYTFNSAFVALALSPVFRGLSVLVKNAEDEIVRRDMVNFDGK